MSTISQTKVTISGRVQGVFFRAHTKETADRLGIKGYVKNLPNGSVEAVFEGDQDTVTRMVAWCRKGSPAAKVDHVVIKETNLISNFELFKIRY